ncbi:MAG TPA: hypothetical protein VGX69_06400, partial [Solirubrobacteraceae bacterium]|nr:hypothetical protein [Solirubrobacteraceae bacterium]
SGASRLARAITSAVEDGGTPATVFVRPWNTFGVRIRARIAACGPPRAALLVLEAHLNAPRPV